MTFIDSARHSISRCLEIVGPRRALFRSGEIDELFRHVHTIKGEAKALRLARSRSESAKLEEELDELRARARGEGFATTGSVHALLFSRFTRATEAIERGCELFVAAVADRTFGARSGHRATLGRARAPLFARRGSDALGRVGARLAARRFGEATVNLAEMAPTWADGEGKRARVQIEGKEVETPPHLAKVLGGVLLHLVRNAVNSRHRVARATRANAKDPHRTHSGYGQVLNPGPTITVEDDGQGLDLTQIGSAPRLLARAPKAKSAISAFFLVSRHSKRPVILGGEGSVCCGSSRARRSGLFGRGAFGSTAVYAVCDEARYARANADPALYWRRCEIPESG